MHPVLGGEVEEPQKRVLVLGYLLDGLRPLGLLVLGELPDGLFSMLTILGVTDLCECSTNGLG